MELHSLTYSVLLTTLAMSLTVSTALPFRSWYKPGDSPTAALDKGGEHLNPQQIQQPQQQQQQPDEDYRRGVQFGQQLALARIGQLMNDQQQQLPQRIDAHDEEDGISLKKRLDFGFAGIDNMDHILSVLARKHNSRSQRHGSSFYKNLKSQGYRGANSIEEMRQIMQNAG